jgi:hypothetical protein
MRYFVFFMLLLLITIFAIDQEEIDFAILLIILDILFLFLI